VLDDHLQAGRRTLRLDMSAVTFLDSTALSALLEFHHRCLGLHGTLLLTRASDPVRRLFRLTRLDGVLLVDHAESDGDSPDGADHADLGVTGYPTGVA
jgi:anti-anti-sigma factor